MRARTIKGSPERTASRAWAEVARMVRETLAPAAAIDDDDVASALACLAGVGPMLISTGVLADRHVVLRALPLQLEMTVSLGTAALSGDERLGKVAGAATATSWELYVPDPEPYAEQVRDAVAGHAALRAGAAPAEPAPTASAGVSIDPDALRRLMRGAR